MHQPNPIIARSKLGAIHNSTHFSGPDRLGQPVAQLEVVTFRWDVIGTDTRVEVGQQSQQRAGTPKDTPACETALRLYVRQREIALSLLSVHHYMHLLASLSGASSTYSGYRPERTLVAYKYEEPSRNYRGVRRQMALR